MGNISAEDRMHPLSRRDMLKLTTGVVAASMTAGAHTNPLGLPIGSQTWPHRQMIKDGGFAALLGTLQSAGVEAIELCSPFGYDDFKTLADPKAVRQALADRGLPCVSAHFSLRELRESQQKSLDWAREIGIT